MKFILIGTLVGVLAMASPNLLCAQTTDSASSKIWEKSVEGDALQMTSPIQEVIIDDYVGFYGIRGGKSWGADTTLLKNAATGNLTQVLQNIPSLSLKRYAPGGLATPAFRGTGAGHTQVYWEGLPLNSSMLGQQDFSLGAGNLFSQVTALYGGSSLTLGSGGLGGAINLSQWPSFPYPFQRELRLRQQAGSWNTYNSSAEAEFSHKNWRSSTRVYFNSADNNFPYANAALPNRPIERLGNARLLQWGGSQFFSHFFKDHKLGYFTGNLWAFRSHRALPPTMLTTTSDESQADAALRGILAWNLPVLERYLKIQTAYFGENMRYRYPQAGIDALSKSQRFIASTNYDMRYSQHKISLQELGLRYIYDQATSDGYVGGAQQHTWSGMARAEWKIKPRNYMSLLMRQEIYDRRLSPILGYLGGSWRLPRLQGNLMANLSRNYRYPTLNDRFWQPGGNPNLRPELSHSVELQFLHQKDLFDWPYNNRNWSIGGFYNHVNDWILWVPGTSNIWHPENVRTVNARGIEASASYAGDISAQLRYKVFASYTFTQSIDQDGYQLIYTPKHIAFARLQVWWGRFDIQYYQDYNSSRYTVADNSGSIPGFSTGDLSLGVRLGKPKVDYTPDSATPEGVYIYPVYKYRRGLLDLQLGMRNLWNAQYQTVAWRPMPGRSVFVRLDWTLSRGTQNR